MPGPLDLADLEHARTKAEAPPTTAPKPECASDGCSRPPYLDGLCKACRDRAIYAGRLVPEDED